MCVLVGGGGEGLQLAFPTADFFMGVMESQFQASSEDLARDQGG